MEAKIKQNPPPTTNPQPDPKVAVEYTLEQAVDEINRLIPKVAGLPGGVLAVGKLKGAILRLNQHTEEDGEGDKKRQSTRPPGPRR